MVTPIAAGKATTYTPSADPAPAAPGAAPAAPHAQLIEMGIAIWKARAVYAAAALGLADLLAAGPRSAEALAIETETHAPSLYRLLRALAACGLFREVETRQFAITPLGAALQSGAPGAARSTILTLAGDWQWKAWEHFLGSLRTGESGLKSSSGKSLFDFLAACPEDGARFDDAMVGMHGALGPALLAAYNFSKFASVVDVGGGTGRLLETLLGSNAKQKGILFEQPATAALARQHLETAGLMQRYEVIEGDFFEGVPAGHQAYILSHVLHDWDDEQCISILRNCRRAIAPGGLLLIVEAVLPVGDAPHHGKMMDLLMLTVTGGKERTALEFGDLLGAANFALARVIPTSTHQSIVEAMPR
jgi:predicted O-methyltransferase YrrM